MDQCCHRLHVKAQAGTSDNEDIKSMVRLTKSMNDLRNILHALPVTRTKEVVEPEKMAEEDRRSREKMAKLRERFAQRNRKTVEKKKTKKNSRRDETEDRVKFLANELYEPPQTKLEEIRNEFKTLRCAHCRGRLPLILREMPCRCLKVYCQAHRSPFKHCCAVDLKKVDRIKLEKDVPKSNPVSRKNSYFDAHPDLPLRPITSKDLFTIDDAGSNEEISDFSYLFQSYYGRFLASMTQWEAVTKANDPEKANEEIETFLPQFKMLARNSLLETVSRERIHVFVEGFGVTLEKYTERLVEWAFPAPQSVIDFSVRYFALMISRQPEFRNHIRLMFRLAASVSVWPTKKGRDASSDSMSIWPMRYLKDKPVSDFTGEEFVIIHKAKQDGLIEMKGQKTLRYRHFVIGHFVIGHFVVGHFVIGQFVIDNESETATKKQVSPNENTPLKQSVVDLDDDDSPIKRTQSKKREISFESDEEIEAMEISPVKEQVAATTPSKVEGTPKTPSSGPKSSALTPSRLKTPATPKASAPATPQTPSAVKEAYESFCADAETEPEVVSSKWTKKKQKIE
uniref:Uncharacterized protein n=1 Tax=Panagrolaimus davidi TaxID=227884 RepID=A0A914PGG8_9BILA